MQRWDRIFHNLHNLSGHRLHFNTRCKRGVKALHSLIFLHLKAECAAYSLNYVCLLESAEYFALCLNQEKKIAVQNEILLMLLLHRRMKFELLTVLLWFVSSHQTEWIKQILTRLYKTVAPKLEVGSPWKVARHVEYVAKCLPKNKYILKII